MKQKTTSNSKGFLHGFLVLSDYAIVTYKVDNYYSAEHDDGVIFNDTDLNIPWPLEKEIEIKISRKGFNS